MTYESVYEKNAAFYNRHPRAKKILLWSNPLLTGCFFAAYSALIVYAFCALQTWDIVKTLAVPAACLCVVAVLRRIVNRPRPYNEGGSFIVPLTEKDKEGHSFPSRHLACAFVIIAVAFKYVSWAGWALTPLGLALGYARFALGLHYPSDLFVGGVLGGLFGLLLLI